MSFDAELVALEAACRGRFTIERELGRGGMAVVVLARDLVLGRLVALKVLPLVLARQPTLRERFLREARTAAGLSHPNIVPIHAVEETSDVVFFSMGYVDGDTLAQRVARGGPLSSGDATRMIQEVAWALAYAHGRGIVHRDVKPDNILIERATGRALVTDFGIARVANATRSLTLEGHVVGTVQFMSPEQAAGEPVDARSDLYALGIVGFYALTGTLPFEASTTTALLAMQVTRPAPPVASRRAGLPARLSAAVDRCLDKNADRRFANAESLADELSAVDARGHDVAPQVRSFQRVAEQSTTMLFLVTAMSLSSAPALGERWYGVLPAPLGAVLVVGFDMLRRARQLRYDGFGARDVVRAFEIERERRNSEVELLFGGPHARRLTRLRRRAIAYAVAAAGTVAFLGWQWRSSGPPNAAMRVVVMLAVLSIVVAVALAFNSSKRAERRSGAAVRRLWRGPFTTALFRLASIRLRPDVHAGAPTAGPQRGELPIEVARALPELPKLLERFDAGLASLADREERIDSALAEAGDSGAVLGDAPAAPMRGDRVPAPTAFDDSTSGATATATVTRATLAHRRQSIIDELRSAREELRDQRTDLLAAHENVRIQLARLRAGVGTPGDLAPDAATLRALLDASARDG